MLALIRVMAGTPYRSWAGCSSFGLRDFFEQARFRPELPREAVDAVNAALRDLGLTKYLVESITSDSPAGRDIDSYSVKLFPADQSGPATSVRL